jgi:NADH:ubiquinone oxidoreductase subunit F (NADH-binding)
VELLTGWTRGSGSEQDLALVNELSQALVLTSICGLGQVVPAPIASVLKHFRDEVDAHITRRECPSGICFSHSPQRATSSIARPA